MTNSKFLKLVHNHLGEYQKIFNNYFEQSSQVILFGSYATDTFTKNSDIDILFVCSKNKIKEKRIDFICLSEKQIHSKLWLGSELACHITKYGVWLKGDDTWTYKVFNSKASIQRKKRIIFDRLVHLYIKREELSIRAREKLFIDVFLDCYRLVLLNDCIAVPPRNILKEDIQKTKDLIFTMNNSMFLGQVGLEFFNQIFPEIDLHDLNKRILTLIKSDVEKPIVKHLNEPD